MKMGTIVSPWRYDVAAKQALQQVNLRRSAIFCYAHGDCPHFVGWYGLGRLGTFRQSSPSKRHKSSGCMTHCGLLSRSLRMRLSINAVREGGRPVRIFGSKQDVTSDRQALESLRQQAETDPLTGSPIVPFFRPDIARSSTTA